ncbi:glycerate kinase [Hypoxylon sp. FL0543]|nr:glycerate kinase [Hypoxylon sp. FL0543]
MRQLRILVAPTGFSPDFKSERVAKAIEQGIREVLPEEAAMIYSVPLYDGEDFFTQPLSSAFNPEIRVLDINSPFFYPIAANLGFIDGGATAVIDVAAAAGPQFISEGVPDPTASTSYGIGELLRLTLDAGCTKVIVDCGDSAALDGGAGMLQALGARLLDANNGDIITIGGAPELSRLATIDMSGIHPRLRKQEVRIEAVCDGENVLCGHDGVAFSDGIARRAPFSQVAPLSLALERYANVVGDILGVNIGNKPWSGVSGGLGTGLMLLGAEFLPRYDAAAEYFHIDTLFIRQWDLVITAAGKWGYHRARANRSRKVVKLAREQGVHVISVWGNIPGVRTTDLYEEGLHEFVAIAEHPASIEERIEDLIEQAAETSVRMVQIGVLLNQAHTGPRPQGTESIIHIDALTSDLFGY